MAAARAPAEAGFWPVKRRSLCLTVVDQGSPFSNVAPRAFKPSSRVPLGRGIFIISSSSLVTAQRVLPATKGVPSDSFMLMRAAGQWQTAATILPAS